MQKICQHKEQKVHSKSTPRMGFKKIRFKGNELSQLHILGHVKKLSSPPPGYCLKNTSYGLLLKGNYFFPPDCFLKEGYFFPPDCFLKEGYFYLGTTSTWGLLLLGDYFYLGTTSTWGLLLIKGNLLLLPILRGA